MPLFDAYLIVDWSAGSHPKTGPDSIWYCLVRRAAAGGLAVMAQENPPTRVQAIHEIRDILRTMAREYQRVLVGFDFPYGYPGGFARALGLTDGPPWQAVWRELASGIVDSRDNRNNRFEVAGKLNCRISGNCYPFWGCPENRISATITPTKGPSGHLSERRISDVGNMQPVWKLYGNGSVGSQALLGIPHVAALRNDPVLAPVSQVWPFETGLQPLPPNEERDYLILHAEIYPSQLRHEPEPGEVKDAAQVRTLATHFAELDSCEQLAGLFAGPDNLTPEERQRVEQEEGWTLGAKFEPRVQPRKAPPPRPVYRAAPRLIHTELPECDYVYFATPACASLEKTKNFTLSANAIIAHAYNQAGIRMPNTTRLRPGNRILLAYGSGTYSPLLACEVCSAPDPVQHLDIFAYIPEPIAQQLQSSGYRPDPIIGRYVGISIGPIEDLRDCRIAIRKPAGNNTLRRWNEVFSNIH